MKAILPIAVFLIGLIGCRDQSTKDRYAELSAEISQLREGNAKSEQSLAKLNQQIATIEQELKSVSRNAGDAGEIRGQVIALATDLNKLRLQIHSEIKTEKITTQTIELADDSSGENQSIVKISPSGFAYSKGTRKVFVGEISGGLFSGLMVADPKNSVLSAINEKSASIMLMGGKGVFASLTADDETAQVMTSYKKSDGKYAKADMVSSSDAAVVRVGQSSEPFTFTPNNRMAVVGVVGDSVDMMTTDGRNNYSRIQPSVVTLFKGEKEMIALKAQEHQNGILIRDPAGRDKGKIMIWARDGRGAVAVDSVDGGINTLSPNKE